jgi:AcrR family transcriptional regulator
MTRATYHSPRRQQAAAATRAAILDAARELFAAQGYAATTIGQIAAAAQVAANTVYTSVGGKAHLLRALMDEGVRDPSVADALEQIARTSDPVTVIRLTAAGTRRLNEQREKDVVILLEGAGADPAAAGIVREGISRYRDALTLAARRLTELDASNAADPGHASDVFWYLFGLHSWRTLIADLGWTWDRAEHWLAQRAIDSLLPSHPKS